MESDGKERKYCAGHGARASKYRDPRLRWCRRCRSTFDDPVLRSGMAVCPACKAGDEELARAAPLPIAEWVKALCLTAEEAAWVRRLGSPEQVLRALVRDRIRDEETEATMERGERERMPNPARSARYKCRLGGTGFYVDVNVYDDDRVGAVFVDLGKVGSPLNAVFKAWSISVSKALQYGVPLREIVESFEQQEGTTAVEPCGFLSCDQVTEIHGREYRNLWAVVADLLRHETDDQGRLKSLVGVETRPSRRGKG